MQPRAIRFEKHDRFRKRVTIPIIGAHKKIYSFKTKITALETEVKKFAKSRPHGKKEYLEMCEAYYRLLDACDALNKEGKILFEKFDAEEHPPLTISVNPAEKLELILHKCYRELGIWDEREADMSRFLR